MQTIGENQVKEKIIFLRNQKIIIDADVAELYGIETKRVNEAVKNNPGKFPNGYIIELSHEEWKPLKSKISTSIKGGKTKLPTGFTERGLYMLATILKSPKAVETTVAIIDTFAKVKELNQIIHQIQVLPENSSKQKNLMENTSNLIADLLIPVNDLAVTETETTYEMNFALFKIKRTIKKGSK